LQERHAEPCHNAVAARTAAATLFGVFFVFGVAGVAACAGVAAGVGVRFGCREESCPSRDSQIGGERRQWFYREGAIFFNPLESVRAQRRRRRGEGDGLEGGAIAESSVADALKAWGSFTEAMALQP
jgi:hypothetical protein